VARVSDSGQRSLVRIPVPLETLGKSLYLNCLTAHRCEGEQPLWCSGSGRQLAVKGPWIESRYGLRLWVIPFTSFDSLHPGVKGLLGSRGGVVARVVN
jgi:hypothetical protein